MAALPSASVDGAVAVGEQHRTFHRFVQSDSDLVGHVAYALYKRDKLKFCDAERAATGAAASSTSVQAFIRSSNLDSRIAAYRDEAERLLEKLTEYVLEDAIEKLRVEAEEALATSSADAEQRLQRARDDYAGELKQLASLQKSWQRVLGEALIGNLVWVLAWSVVIFAVWANKYGLDALYSATVGSPPAIASKP